MRVIVTLLVRDEEDIIADNLRYHLDAGADLILVTDNGSVDSTRDIVQRFVDDGTARLLEEPAPTHSQWRWVTRMARIAYWDHGADWVINTDADEFWWPRWGSLKDVLGSVEPGFGTVRVPRFDFRPLAGIGGGPRETPYRETSSLRFIGGPLEPKTCHRGDPRVVVGQGNHEVSGLSGAELDGSDLMSVFHFPTRSLEQFRRGVGNAGAAYSQSTEFVSTTGEVKRALYEALEDGTLDDVFGSRELSEDEAQTAIREGQIVSDRRLMEALAAPAEQRSLQGELVVVTFDGGITAPVLDRLRERGETVRHVGFVGPDDAFSRARVLTLLPTPTEWVGRAVTAGTDVEEAAYAWLGTVVAIGATAASPLWISPSLISDDDGFDAVVSWLDDPGAESLLEAPRDEDAALSASEGPALMLARSAYAMLRSEPAAFGPIARLLRAVVEDDIVASRLSWYLGPPDAGSDVLGELEERLSGAEASYDAVRSRKSVRIALAIADASGRLAAAFRRAKA